MNYDKLMKTSDLKSMRNKVDPKVEKLSLSQMGISTWNPSTTSFLDYIISLRSIFFHYNVTQPRAIHLLFSSLPSKYSYVRNAVRSYPDFDMNGKIIGRLRTKSSKWLLVVRIKFSLNS